MQYHTNNDLSFQFTNKNGDTLFKSISFKNEEEMNGVISTLQKIPNKLKLFERKTNHEGLFLFKLKNDQGQIIGTSEHYNSEAGMENGIKNIITAIEN